MNTPAAPDSCIHSYDIHDYSSMLIVEVVHWCSRLLQKQHLYTVALKMLRRIKPFPTNANINSQEVGVKTPHFHHFHLYYFF